MSITGLHLLLSYQCNYECDHCFVWGGPDQDGTLTLGQIAEILRQARGAGSVEWIYFEGGEPFLYAVYQGHNYPVTPEGVDRGLQLTPGQSRTFDLPLPDPLEEGQLLVISIPGAGRAEATR